MIILTSNAVKGVIQGARGQRSKVLYDVIWQGCPHNFVAHLTVGAVADLWLLDWLDELDRWPKCRMVQLASNFILVLLVTATSRRICRRLLLRLFDDSEPWWGRLVITFYQDSFELELGTYLVPTDHFDLWVRFKSRGSFGRRRDNPFRTEASLLLLFGSGFL